jgi:16S rRNA processing protein RimM
MGSFSKSRRSAFPRGVLLKLAGVDDRDRAETLRGNSIWVEHWQRISLPKGEYFVDDLIGFQVVTDTGEAVGSLEAVWNMPANDVFLVRTVEGLQILIPATRNIVRAIEVEKRLMVVESWGVSQ